jgi:glucosamine-6-phosphate deaminase
MTLDYYSIPAEDFHKYSNIEFQFVSSHKDLCKSFARELVDLIKTNLDKNQMTKIILPIGPLDYHWFAELCNRENISCESLVIFSMDEYCDANGKALPAGNPLSFSEFYRTNLVEYLDPDKRFPPEQLIFPDPADLDLVIRKMEKYGPIDVTYGGSGIDGHYAFNFCPKNEGTTVEDFKNTSVHIAELPESFIVQMAMGGTGGNLEFVPPKGVSLGMKELLSAKKLHLTFMRTWHAGVLRRALFGPVTPKFPTSLVQLHSNVKATITAAATPIPVYDHLQSPGK